MQTPASTYVDAGVVYLACVQAPDHGGMTWRHLKGQPHTSTRLSTISGFN